MLQRRITYRLLAAALALSLTASACSDDETATDDSTTSAAPGAEGDATGSDAAGDGAEEEGDAEEESGDSETTDSTEAADDEEEGDSGGEAAGSGDPAYAAAKETLAAFLEEHQPADATESTTTVAGCPLIDTATLSAAQESVGGEPISEELETQISWGGPPQIQIGCGVNLSDPAGETALVAVAAGDTGDQTLDDLIADSAQPLTVEGERAVGCDETSAFCLALTVIDGLAVTAVVNGDSANPETALSILDGLVPAVVDTLSGS